MNCPLSCDTDSFLVFKSPETISPTAHLGSWEKIDIESFSKKGFILTDFNKQNTFQFDATEEIDVSRLDNVDLPITSNPIPMSSKEEYLITCQKYISLCREGDLKKIILSRIKWSPLKNTIKLGVLFQELCTMYPNAFNYVLNIPRVGCWIGASPEILLTSSESSYNTMALAGTKPKWDITKWNSKELKEHKYVVDYISDVLVNNDLSFKRGVVPETVVAGNVKHLKTDFKIDHFIDPIKLAIELHPTPAVCGVPKNEALRTIDKEEGHDRCFYTGFLGCINKERIRLFVNLRCAQLFSNRIAIYVGGGITADSVPENEWKETEYKSQTLLSVIEKIQNFAS